jgi:hypothetical protein
MEKSYRVLSAEVSDQETTVGSTKKHQSVSVQVWNDLQCFLDCLVHVLDVVVSHSANQRLDTVFAVPDRTSVIHQQAAES